MRERGIAPAPIKGGGGGGYVISDSDAQAIVDAYTSEPDDVHKEAIETRVLALKAAGLWASRDFDYMWATSEQDGALINWKSPGTFDAIAVNSPTFTADEGFTLDGTSQYIRSGYNPAAEAGNYAQDSAHVTAMTLLAPIGANNPLIGVLASVSSPFARVLLRPRNASNNMQAIINSVYNVIDITVANTLAAHWILSRTGASATAVYRDGAAFGAGTQSSVGNIGEIISFGYDAQTGDYGAHKLTCGSGGAAMTAGEASDSYDADAAFLTTVGAI